MKSIDIKKLVQLNNLVGDEKAKQIHLEIMEGILRACSVQPKLYEQNKGLAIQVSQETVQILQKE